MNHARLGRTGLQVSRLCLGTMTFGLQSDEATAAAILDRAAEGGIDFLDTSDAYPLGGDLTTRGVTEEILGRWLHGKRDRFIVATKCFAPTGPAPFDAGNSRQHILAAVEASLRRLQTDYIDLYQSHHDDETVPQAETMGIYAELIAAGKVRTIGASNFTAERLQSALEVSRQQNLPRYETLQPEYNLYDRGGYEYSLEAICVEHGLGVIPYFSLASGFLSGKYRSAEDAASRPRAGMLKKYFNERGMRILESLREVASELKATPAQVALAWLMARPSITAPIASATTVAQLHELVEATRLELPQEAIDKLNQASAEAVAA